jgi:hypothetical protein
VLQECNTYMTCNFVLQVCNTYVIYVGKCYKRNNIGLNFSLLSREDLLEDACDQFSDRSHRSTWPLS